MTKQGEVWRDTAVKYAKHIASLEIELRALEAERDALKGAIAEFAASRDAIERLAGDVEANASRSAG